MDCKKDPNAILIMLRFAVETRESFVLARHLR